MESTNNNTTIITKTTKKGNFGRTSTSHSTKTTKRIKKSTKVIETGNKDNKPKANFMRKLSRPKVSKGDKVRSAPTENTTITTKNPKSAEQLTRKRAQSLRGNKDIDPMFSTLDSRGLV